jgi:H+/Cl- antiporter ClcA
MKIKNFIFFVFISAILSGLIGIVFISAHNYKEISMQINQNQIHIPNSYQPASILGVIGVLGISRKKKNIGGHAS